MTEANARLHARIAVIDDDQDICQLLVTLLEGEGLQVQIYNSPMKLLAKLKGDNPEAARPDLILSDIMMPEMDGLKFIQELQHSVEDVPIIFITAHGSMEVAIQAMRAGAFDFILKPFNLPELKVAVARALKFQLLERDNSALRKQIKGNWEIDGIVGKSLKIQQLFDLIKRISKTDVNVLISGESGTGKELVARAIHKESNRNNGPFVAINCSAIPEALLESELFGHAKGAFTGAIARKRGLFEEANSGTLFLDEIGDMNINLQAKLLRVIQERKIKPVGDNSFHDIDVRIIAATHKNLKTAIKSNEFREDLFYRLSVIPVDIPPLRARAEDIPLLAEHFLKKYSATHNVKVRAFTKAALNKLVGQTWPGNVRELENTVERAVILCESDFVDAHLIRSIEGDVEKSSTELFEQQYGEDLTLKEIEKRYIQFVLSKTEGVKEKAARILGIDRKTLYRKEKDYGFNGSSGGGSDAELS